MPRIQLERIFPNDSINLRSILLWPGINDVERRKQFFAADYANGFVHDGDENAVYPWKTVLIRTLLEAPSWSDLKQQVAERTRRGVIAGYVFCFMFLMEQYKDRIPKRGSSGASLNKAFFLAEQWGKGGATYGDGARFYGSEKRIKDCWSEFRGVAHIWAAFEFNKVAEFAPQKELFLPEHFHKFMQASAYMQMFGSTLTLSNKSKQSRDVLLPKGEYWEIDTLEYPPTLLIPIEQDAFDDAPFMKILRQYSSV